MLAKRQGGDGKDEGNGEVVRIKVYYVLPIVSSVVILGGYQSST